MWIHYGLGVLSTLFVIALWRLIKWSFNITVCYACKDVIYDNAAKHEDSRQFHALCLVKERSKPAIGECLVCRKDIYPIDSYSSYGEKEKIHRRCAQCDDCGKAFNSDQRIIKVWTNTFYHEHCEIYTCSVCQCPATCADSTMLDGKVLKFHRTCACKHCGKYPKSAGNYLCEMCIKELGCSLSGCTGTVSLIDPIKSFKLNQSFCSIDCRYRALNP